MATPYKPKGGILSARFWLAFGAPHGTIEDMEITQEQKQTIYEALKRMALYHNKKINELKSIPQGLVSTQDKVEMAAHLEEFNKAVDLIGQIDDGLV